MAIEKKFWEEGTQAFFEKSMDQNAVSVMEPMGFIEKSTAVEMSAHSKGWDDVKMHDLKFVQLTPDCVALIYHGEATNRETGEPSKESISSVYVKKDGEWKLALTTHQPWEPEKAH